MAINPELVKAGDVLYDVHKYKMGNTTMRATGCWDVRVLEVIQPEEGDRRRLPTFRVSWNGNPPRIYGWNQIRKLRRSRPKGL
jgi:hypothetical protein